MPGCTNDERDFLNTLIDDQYPLFKYNLKTKTVILHTKVEVCSIFIVIVIKTGMKPSERCLLHDIVYN